MGIAKSSFYYGVLHVKGGGHGWCEKYHLGGLSNYVNARTAFLHIVLARTMILANDFVIHHARVSRLDVKRERKVVPGVPFSPLNTDTEAGSPPVITACNDVKSCIQISFETDTGAWNNRLIRGIRDAWVTGNTCVVTPSIPASVVLGDLVAGKTKEVALGSYMRAVMDLDVHKYADTTPGQEGTLITEPWTSAAVVQVTSRDTGKAFRSGRGRAPVFNAA